MKEKVWSLIVGLLLWYLCSFLLARPISDKIGLLVAGATAAAVFSIQVALLAMFIGVMPKLFLAIIPSDAHSNRQGALIGMGMVCGALYSGIYGGREWGASVPLSRYCSGLSPE